MPSKVRRFDAMVSSGMTPNPGSMLASLGLAAKPGSMLSKVYQGFRDDLPGERLNTTFENTGLDWGVNDGIAKEGRRDDPTRAEGGRGGMMLSLGWLVKD